MRRYVVSAMGFHLTVEAPNAGRAKYLLYKQLRDAGYRLKFKDFITEVHVYGKGRIDEA